MKRKTEKIQYLGRATIILNISGKYHPPKTLTLLSKYPGVTLSTLRTYTIKYVFKAFPKY